MQIPEILGIIAGNGVYPRILASGARKAGVKKIVAAAFTDETDPSIDQNVDLVEWLRVGQLGRLGESRRGHCGHKDTVGAAAGLLDDLRRRIRRFGVDGYFRA